jgi:hypothetical protein
MAGKYPQHLRVREVELTDGRSMFLTGYAPGGTYWNEAEGGNVTVKSFGKIYEREGEWKFMMNSVD